MDRDILWKKAILPGYTIIALAIVCPIFGFFLSNELGELKG